MNFVLEKTSTRRLQRDPFVVEYRGFLLKFRPQPTPDGRFLAYVIVSRRCRSIHTEASVTPELPSFVLQADAAHAGRAAGVRWVDTNI